MDGPKTATQATVRLIAEDDKSVNEIAKPVNRRHLW